MPLPDMTDAIGELADQVIFVVISKGIKDFEITEIENSQITFTGCIQSLTPKQLQIKPEGQRGWNYRTLFTIQNLELDFIILDGNGIQYRVTEKSDRGTLMQYELTENPLR